MIAPDETTFDYLFGREFAPSGEAWDGTLRLWRSLQAMKVLCTTKRLLWTPRPWNR